MTEHFKSAKSSQKKIDRFDLLATEKGWTPEMLRKCGDCPKTALPLGVKEYCLPVEAMEDPFKGKPPQNADTEYQNLHKNFYEKLKRILSSNEMKAAATPAGSPPPTPPPTSPVVKIAEEHRENPVLPPLPNNVGVQVMGPNRMVQIRVTKNTVQANINLPPAK